MSQYKEVVLRLSRIDSSRFANSLRALPLSGLSDYTLADSSQEHMLLPPSLAAEREKFLFPSFAKSLFMFRIDLRGERQKKLL